MKGSGTFVIAGLLPVLALGGAAWAGIPGDICEDAIPIECGEAVLGSTVGATPASEAFCGTSDGTGGAIWYAVIGTGTEITANLCNPGTLFDTKLRVYSGECDALECVGGNDDFDAEECFNPASKTAPRSSRVTWCSEKGLTYYILVHGFGTTEGEYELDVTCGDVECGGCDGSIIGISILTDDFPEETSWEVTDKDTMTVIASGGPYVDSDPGSLILDEVCVDPDGCYNFTIFDAFGDGICCTFGEGEYVITFDGEEVGSGGDFGSSETVGFIGGNCPCDGDLITVEIDFDDFSSETSYEITDQSSGEVVASADFGAGEVSDSASYCLPAGCYNFTIFDDFGDGICCAFGEGEYRVFLNGELVGSGGDFASSETVASIGTDCPCEDNIARIEISLDDFPQETSWEVTDKDSLKVVASGGPYPGKDFETIIEELCLPDGCYNFTIFDEFGDGICCGFGDGSYRVLFNGVLQGFGGEFADSETTAFGTSCPDGNPSLSLGLASGECVGEGEEILVSLSMSNMGGFPAAGYQAFLGYDAGLLAFEEATYTDVPYGEHIILGDDINPSAGAIDLAAGIDLLGGQPDSAADAVLVTLRFTALSAGGCEGKGAPVFFRDSVHPTRFTDRAGTAEVPRTFDAPAFSDTTPPDVSDCPGDIGTNSDAGGCGADVSWTAPTVVDNCDPSPSLVYEIDIDSDGSVDIETGDTSASLPAGDHTVTAVATDACGNVNDSCSFSVSISATNTLVVSGLELQATVVSPLTRCITFELESCAGDGSVVISQEVEFIDGAAADISIEVDCGDYICVSARDELHTLASTADLTLDGGAYGADLSGNPLLGGDLNDDGVIEILDFGIFVDKLSQFVDLTDCDSKGPNADINGNGLVFTEDYTFIQINFLEVDQVCCELGALAGPAQPRTRISVAELFARGLGNLAVADLNGDGWVDTADMAAFAAGVRPGDIRSHDTSTGSLKK